MLKLLLVGFGGFIGSVLRYLLSGAAHQVMSRGDVFPHGTLFVNVLGALLIGFLGGLTESRQLFTPEIRLFLLVGVLGGFTTFSTFTYESFALARDGQYFVMGSNVILHLVLTFAAVWIGYALSQVI